MQRTVIKMCNSLVIIAVFGLLLVECTDLDTSGNFENQQSQFCMDINNQKNLDINQIIGTWYSAEILSHNEEQKGIFYYNTCVIIHITDETDIITQSTTTVDYSAEQRDYYLNHAKRLLPTTPGNRQLHQKPIPQFRYLKLVWDEMGKDLSYKLKYNESNQGLWISYQDQEGTISDLTYTQFSGTVQVVKAVQNHLVLTFCNRKVNGSFFSVILTRRPNALSEDDIRSNRNLLRRRGLSTSSIRKVCSSGSEFKIAPTLILLMLIIKNVI